MPVVGADYLEPGGDKGMMSESPACRRLLAAAVMLAALPALAAAQAATRVIEWGKPQKGQLYRSDYGQLTDYYAVQVREIRVEGKPVAVGRPFAAAADWTKTLTLKVRNTSGRSIRHLYITLALPEWRGEGGVGHGAVVLTYPPGDISSIESEVSVESEHATIEPGEEVELSLRCEAAYCARHRAALDEASAAFRITRAVMHGVKAEFNRYEFWWGFYIPPPTP